jgi:hypothetical protein
MRQGRLLAMDDAFLLVRSFSSVTLPLRLVRALDLRLETRRRSRRLKPKK